MGTPSYPDAADPLALPDERLYGGYAPGGDAQATGRVNTPAALARWMALEAVKAAGSTRDLRSLTVVEPAAGSGVIVAALVEALSRQARRPDGDRLRVLQRIWAIDSDHQVRRAAGRRLRLVIGRSPSAWLQRHYHIGDSLLDPALLPRHPIDLIIGNPPYLGARHARRLPSFGRWQERFSVREDLYAYFMRWAIQTVRPGGHVVLLVPDSWLSLQGYEDLRRRLLRGRLRLIVRLPADTFDRQVFPCFFVWQKAAPRWCRVCHIDARQARLSSSPVVSRVQPVRRFTVRQSLFTQSPHGIMFVPTKQACETAALWQALSRRQEHAATLQQVACVADVGIHSRNCRHHLFSARRTKPGLQRLLQGRQIERYAVRWDSPRAQYRWVDIHYVPKRNVRGRCAKGRPSVRNEYWDWQGDPAIHRLPQRILIRQTGDHIVAARCIQKRAAYYTDNTLFTATLTEAAVAAGISYAYLVAYLNSEIVSRLYRFLSGEQGRAQAQVKVGLLRRLPFVRPDPKSISRIGALVQEIEEVAAKGASASAQQKAIDRHFARLFTSAANGMLRRERRVSARVAAEPSDQPCVSARTTAGRRPAGLAHERPRGLKSAARLCGNA